MTILGLSCFYHDSAACLIKDGQIVAAAQEERFSRKKHDESFPRQAVTYCLATAGLPVEKLDCVVFYDKPFLKFERLLETYLEYAPRGLSSYLKAMPVWLGRKLWLSRVIADELGFQGRILYTSHHGAHAASAFFPSPYDQAAILTIDGVGEWETTTWGIGRGREIELRQAITFPHSLGLLYSAFTYYLGFKVNSGEYKVMGLAPYGQPKYVQTIYDHLFDVKTDGSFRLNLEFFDYPVGLVMTNRRFHQLFGGPPRRPESPLTQREMDLAASIQAVTNDLVLKLARYVRQETGLTRLCLAGGVALNCVANGLILQTGIFDDLWIQPAAGDAGGALGAALAVWHEHYRQARPADGRNDRQQGSLLGPEFTTEEIATELERLGAKYERLSDAEVISRTAKALAAGQVVGWFQGRMEFGPRALGNRSILGDPRQPDMQSRMNLKIKFRESFRPFAPSVLLEHADEYFELNGHQSPYMLLTAAVREQYRRPVDPANLWGIEKLKQLRSDIPAVTHVDYSARIQTVDAAVNPRYDSLLRTFQRLTGCPVLVNTSFNVRGEPIVCTPADAYRCFRRTEMDILTIGNCFLRRGDQPPVSEQADWRQKFSLD